MFATDAGRSMIRPAIRRQATTSNGRTIEDGSVTLYSPNGKIVSLSFFELAKTLEGANGHAVIDGELVAVGKDAS